MTRSAFFLALSSLSLLSLAACNSPKNNHAGANPPPAHVGAPCAPQACGPAPGMPSYPCPDGSMAGPRCVQQPHGACGWLVMQCSVPDALPPGPGGSSPIVNPLPGGGGPPMGPPPIEPPLQPPPAGGTPTGSCAVGGCSGTLCGDADKLGDLVSTCEYRPEYACYKSATCARQPSGQCGWTDTPQLRACLASPPSL